MHAPQSQIDLTWGAGQFTIEKGPNADDMDINCTENLFKAFYLLTNPTRLEIEEVKLLLLLPHNSTGPTLSLYQFVSY